MESSLYFYALFSLAMIAVFTEARPNPAEYMQESLVRGDSSVLPLPTKESHCHTTVDARKKIKPSDDKQFEPRPNVSVYGNGMGLKDLKGKKTYQEEFEPRPNVSVYDNDVRLDGKKTLDHKFEPRPNVSVYNG
ncbi:organ specific protein [Artemisia annua]|uniref:Organ specific protein n=1 Tax=Artemisia annua TaxID=35608 RepID=A0A2U1MJA4_ARTAN|nr:organ specific protein [Artemisia annua]